ncbi:CDP-glycerol glycerophosphotransferase family protein [Halobacillus shinanisalinarum]|uniref:CDP-glycerol glycerophosphotransferase family protein n=1 Tax=Halobacillus shinanisalinarum TaxID=2932258 RepID=A0ABY4H2B4_9BACI|nr:CDP-glycerol glycerophosphotransferase family protein [Halobacillus shinanisalinarum]UOQ94426.1 CDP-glycerol glycerophosphotransferase family protein [Halobacillus shinanisalinarum]
MAREFLVSMYLLTVRILFNAFKLSPQRKKTVFVSSFGDNILYTVEALKKQYSGSIVILKDSGCRYSYKEDPQTAVLPFDLKNPYAFILSIYHLATCEKVFVDNYFGFLAAADFRDNVECIQLWHASGAVKRFGLKDPSIEARTKRANDRFLQVYDKFDHVVVGSDKMAKIFKESFGLSDDKILRTGVPRTDFFFEHSDSSRIRANMEKKHPRIKGKKVILYAPTFRDHQLTDPDIQLNLKLLYETLQDDYVLMMRLHPAVKTTFANSYPNFIIDVSTGENINELLMVTDLLITDYSSIPYEFSLLNKPMIFYSYDLEDYSRARGFWEDYHSMVPGPVAYTSEEIVEIILNEPYNMKVVNKFAQDWNEYSNGQSSLQLIQALYGDVTEKEDVLFKQR